MAWHPLRPADDEFLLHAPLRVHCGIDIDAPPEAVWAVLSADDAVVSWSRVVTGARWTTGPVRAAGCVREVTLLRVLGVREQFYRWDAPRRQTFSATHTSRPGVRRFAEDYALEPTPHGTRLAWTLAIELSILPGVTGRLARPIATRTLTSMLRAIRRQAVDPAPPDAEASPGH